MDETDKKSNVTPPSNLRRRLIWVGGGLVIAVVALYFIVTSSSFIKGFILPRVGGALHATVTAQDVSLSPFSSIRLRGLKLQTTGTEPLVQAEEARVRYSLWAFLGGRIEVKELTLNTPVIQIVQNPDGTSNLDPILEALSSPAETPAKKPSTDQKPKQLSVQNVALNQATLRWTSVDKLGARQTAEIRGLTATLDRLQNAQPGKLVISAEARFETAGGAVGAVADQIQAKINGTFDYALDAALLPRNVTGSLRGEVMTAQGSWKDMAALTGTLECQITPEEIKNLALRFDRGGAGLGRMRIFGPMDLAKKEAHLSVETMAIDRQVLNLFGAAHGWDFAQTQINATNRVDVTQQGQLIDTQGRLAAKQFGLRFKDRTTPPVDLDVDYQVTVDLNTRLLIQRLKVSGRQGEQELIRTDLDRPMNIAWGDARGYKEASLRLTVTNLNLGDWSLLLGPSAPAGRFSLQGQINSQNDGQLVKVDLAGQVLDFSAKLGTNALTASKIQLELKGGMEDFKKITLDPYRVTITDSNQTLLSASGLVSYDPKSEEKRVSLIAEAALAGLLRKYPVAGFEAAEGNVKINGVWSQQPKGQTVTGTAALESFTGQFGGYRFTNYQARVDSDLEMKEQVLKFNRLGLTAGQGYDAGGSCDISGTVNLAKTNAQLSYTIVDLNHKALSPFVVAALAPRTLESISVTSKGTVSYEAQGTTTVKAGANVANLVLREPNSKGPNQPLNVQLQLDTAWEQQHLLRLNQFLLTVLQSGQPAGRFELTGTTDLTNRAVQVSFKLAEFNQVALGPWLSTYLAPRTLNTAALNGTGSIAYDPTKDSVIKAEIGLTNLTVKEAGQTNASKPLSLQLQVDSAVHNQVIELRPSALTLSPTDRAKNQLQTTGRFDMSGTNGMAGQLTVRAESLDLAPFWGLFGLDATNRTKKPKPVDNTPRTEPAASPLPTRDFALDVKVDRLYVGEMVITNWQAIAKINGGNVKIDPFTLSLNGAPVASALTMNLGVPGYTYDLALQTGLVPLDPIVTTFDPSNRGLYPGHLLIQGAVKGAGITDASLQKNLSGQALLAYTNANMSLISPKMKTLMTPIALVLGLNDLLSSPLDAVAGKLDIGQGVAKLEPLAVYSPAFQAQGTGTVTLASMLTNSTINLPVTLYLQRTMAAKANLLPPNAPTNAQFVELPPFVKVTGTLGTPKTDIDKLAAAQIGARTILAVPGALGIKAGSQIDAVQNLLSSTNALSDKLRNLVPGLGTNSSSLPNAGTNVPASGNRPLGGLLQGLGNVLAASNSPPASSSAPSGLGGLNNLLNNRLTNRPAATNRPLRGVLQNLGAAVLSAQTNATATNPAVKK